MTPARFDFSAPIHGHVRLEEAWLRHSHGAMIDLIGELGLPGAPVQVLARKKPPAVGLLHTSLVLWAEQTSVGPECGIQYRRRGKLGGRTVYASLALLSNPRMLAERIIAALHLRIASPGVSLERTTPPLPEGYPDAYLSPTVETPGDI